MSENTKQNELERFSVSIPNYLNEKLEKTAKEDKRTKSNLLTVILDDHLDSYSKDPKAA